MPGARVSSLVPVNLNAALAADQTPSGKRLIARNANAAVAAAARSVAPTGRALKRTAPLSAAALGAAVLRTPPAAQSPPVVEIVDVAPPPPAFSPGAIGRSVVVSR
jgi:hypothetical protein